MVLMKNTNVSNIRIYSGLYRTTVMGSVYGHAFVVRGLDRQAAVGAAIDFVTERYPAVASQITEALVGVVAVKVAD